MYPEFKYSLHSPLIDRHWLMLLPRCCSPLTIKVVLAFLSFLLLKIIIFNWRIIAVQDCVGFCYVSTWISRSICMSPPSLTSSKISWFDFFPFETLVFPVPVLYHCYHFMYLLYYLVIMTFPNLISSSVSLKKKWKLSLNYFDPIMHAWMLSHCHVQLFATTWIVAKQAPLFIGFSRQVSWSG